MNKGEHILIPIAGNQHIYEGVLKLAREIQAQQIESSPQSTDNVPLSPTQVAGV